MKNIHVSRTTLLAAWITCVPAALFASTITDPLGDSTSHDVASVSAVYNATHMLMDATFFPGTLNQNNLGFIFGFDLDQNAATGTQPPSSFPLGAERSVSFNTLDNATNARVFTGNSFVFAPVSFGVDSLSLAMPLSALGNDGSAYFGFVVGDPVNASTLAIRDFAPDSALGNPLSTPTTFVPEPCTLVVAIAGVLALPGVGATGRHRRGLRSN